MLAPSLGLLFAAGDGAGAPAPQAISTRGFHWGTELRLTSDSANDLAPRLWVDRFDLVELLWRRANGGNESFFRRAFDPGLEVVGEPTYLTWRGYRNPYGNFPYGATADRDWSGDYHFVFDYSEGQIGYEKVAKNGTVLVAAKGVGTRDGSTSTFPSVSLGDDDAVNIASADCKFRCYDLFSTRLTNDGYAVWENRVVAQNVNTGYLSSVLKLDPLTGHLYYLWTSNNATWYASTDRSFNLKGSSELRHFADGEMADVAVSPNGNAHFVWREGGSVVYSVFDANGHRMVDRRVISSGAINPSRPRIADFPDSDVAVVWDDERTGSRQVFMAAIDAGQENVSAVPTNFQISDSTGNATDPWVEVGRNEDLHIAWSDTRNGDPDIYYIRSTGCLVDVFADPLDLANMYFIGANQTGTLPLRVKNNGAVRDNFQLSFEVAQPANVTPWGLSLNRTQLAGLDPGKSQGADLAVSVPASALDNEHLGVRVLATGANGTCVDELPFDVYARIYRSLRIEADETQKAAANGENVSFWLILKNMGDFREDGIEVFLDSHSLYDWSASLSLTSASLDPGESIGLEFSAVVPPTAGGDVPVRFDVFARSGEDPNYQFRRALTVVTKLNMSLEIDAFPDSATADPGDAVPFVFHIRNIGNLQGAARIDLRTNSSFGWRAGLSQSTLFLEGGESEAATLDFWVPDNARRGSTYTVSLRADSLAYGVNATIEVYVHVRSACFATLGPLDSLRGQPGSIARISFWANNSGDLDADIQFEFGGTAAPWSPRVLDGGIPSLEYRALAFSNHSLSVEIPIPMGTSAGNYTLHLNARSPLCYSSSKSTIISVPPVGAVEISTGELIARIGPGSAARYNLTLQSTANHPTSVWLQAGDLPASYPAHFFVTRDGRSIEGTADDGILVGLAPYEEVAVALEILVPLEAQWSGIFFQLRTLDSLAQGSVRSLEIQLVRPDLFLEGAALTSGHATAGLLATFDVGISNRGGIASGPGRLLFFVNGALKQEIFLAPLEPAQRLVVQAVWMPGVGSHALRFEVSIIQGAPDLNETSNAFEMQIEIAAPPAVGTMSIWPAGYAAAIIAGAAVGIGAVLVLRQRRK